MIRAFIQSIVDINILFRKHDHEDDLLSLIKRFQSVKVVVLGPSVREQRPLQQGFSLTVHMSFLQTGISLEFVYHDYTWISSSLSYRGIKRDDVDLSFITALSTPPPPLIPSSHDSKYFSAVSLLSQNDLTGVCQICIC